MNEQVVTRTYVLRPVPILIEITMLGHITFTHLYTKNLKKDGPAMVRLMIHHYLSAGGQWGDN